MKLPVLYRNRNPADEETCICGASSPNRARCSTSRIRFVTRAEGEGDDIESGSPPEISEQLLEVHRPNLIGKGREPDGARTFLTSVTRVEARKGTDSSP